MAEETSRLSREAYKKLKDSDKIMSWGVDELNQRAVFCAIREYIISPNYGEDAAKEIFFNDLKEQDFWEDEPGTLDDEHLQNTVKTLRGEIRRDWKREDFLVSDADCDDNVYLFATEFIRYLHIEKSLEWVTGDLFFELVMEYFGEVPERKDGFYFSFSKEYLDKYLVSYFDFLSLNDARGMAVRIALEYFSAFLHEKGILSDAELRKIKKGIEDSKEKLREVHERSSWKYRFLERWK